ncbi:hypothetical protein EPO66_00845, partial [bacterium]
PFKRFIKQVSSLTLFLIFLRPLYAAELPKYEINAEIDSSRHVINASQKLIFTNNSDKEISEVYFHIYPHRKYKESEKRFLGRYAAYFKVNPFPEGFQSGDLIIKSAISEGQALTYDIEGKDESILKVDLKRKISPGESAAVELVFQVNIPHAYGRFGWHNNVISLLRWYPMLSVLDNEGWHNYPFYPYHQPYFSDAAYYSVNLTVNSKEVLAHSGISRQEINNSNGTKTVTIDSELPLRDFGICLSPDYAVESSVIKGVKINSYYLPGDLNSAKHALEFAAGLIDYYSKEFADYPYKEFNIAPSYLAYGGTQSSGLVLIDTRNYRLPGFLIRYFDFLVSHETGHQWFYNLVGSDEYRQMFIDEGFNSFFIIDYLNYKYGPNAQVMVLPKGIKWLIPNFSFQRAQVDRYLFVAKNGLDRPVLGELSSFKEPSAIFSITYGKGSKIVGMLKAVLGDEVFAKLMQRYFKEYAFKNISSDKLKELASSESGKDLNYFFNSWLKTENVCDYAVRSVNGAQAVIDNLGSINMPLDIKIIDNEKKVSYYSWDGAGPEKIINSEPGTKISSVRIDPDNKILDVDRVNNNWPRKLDLRLVPVYSAVYEIPAILKEDSYNLIAGPQIGDWGLKVSLQKPQDNILYISGGYNFGEDRFKNVLGFEQKHLGNKMRKWGIEAYNYQGIGEGTDQEGLKVYLRQELWPASYGLLDENDHYTLYFLRDRNFNGSIVSGSLEDIKNLHYRQEDEAIFGANFKFGRYGAYPDPSFGWKLNAVLENAQHVLGGQDYFFRFSPQLIRYFGLSPKQKLAAKAKIGLGYPADKGLFQLGGQDGLRGYSYKTINGSQAMMFSGEYRLDLKNNLDLSFCDRIVTLKKI